MEPVALGEREYHLFEYMLGSGLVRGGGGDIAQDTCHGRFIRGQCPFQGSLGSGHLRAISGKLSV